MIGGNELSEIDGAALSARERLQEPFAQPEVFIGQEPLFFAWQQQLFLDGSPAVDAGKRKAMASAAKTFRNEADSSKACTELAYKAYATMPAVLTRRLFAAVGLMVLAVVEIAPHNHADSLFSKPLVIHCDGGTAAVPHLHPTRAPQNDGCLACFRQHMQLTASKIALGSPQILAQFFVVTARVSHARVIRLRKFSRGPPALLS